MLQLLTIPRDGAGGSSGAPQVFQITDEQIRKLIATEGGGDIKKALRVLMKENRKLREDRRTEREKVEKLEKDNRIAPDGGVVLDAEQAKSWKVISKHLTESKTSADDLIKAAAKSAELQGELETRKRREVFAEAADDLGWNPDALTDVLELKKLELAMREVTVTENGKKVKQVVPHVRAAGDEKAEWSPLESYADENFSRAVMTTLESVDEEEEEGGYTRDAREEDTASVNGNRPRQTERRVQSGTPMPRQSRSKTPGPAGKTDKEARDEAVSTGIYGGL